MRNTSRTWRRNMATKSWRTIQELHSKRSPEERAETKRRALADLEMERMRLGQLRRAKALSQQTLAETLEIAQGDVSKIERRSDIYVRPLRRQHVAALKGMSPSSLGSTASYTIVQVDDSGADTARLEEFKIPS